MPHTSHLLFFSLLAVTCTGCPFTWTNFEDTKCVKLFPVELSEGDAVNKCREFDAKLLRVKDADEWETLRPLVAQASYAKVWTDDPSAPFFGNQNGESCGSLPLDVSGSVPVKRMCPLYSFQGNRIKRCNANCDDQLTFGCEKPYTSGEVVPQEVEASNYTCPSGLVPWKQYCYQFLAGRHFSNRECSLRHGKQYDLKPESIGEEEFLRTTMKHLGYEAEAKVWVDANCTLEPCTFKDGARASHVNVDTASCKAGTNPDVYWHMAYDEWICTDSSQLREKYYSVCKLDATLGTEVLVDITSTEMSLDTSDEHVMDEEDYWEEGKPAPVVEETKPSSAISAASLYSTLAALLLSYIVLRM
ncbi:hypothetical protein HDE_06069 [Halotydeus destructor]|nr:hypothetical protein HDE_06069 [Halotydeus destructor]